MICLVCSKKYGGGKTQNEICPVCGFRAFDIVGDPNVELPKYKPMIDKHREKFMKGCSAGCAVCHWVRDAGVVKKKDTFIFSFGNLAELTGKTVWLDRAFDSLAKRNKVEIPVEFAAPNKTYRHKVSIPTCEYGDSYSLGITVDENFMFSLVACAKDKKEFRSDKKYIFE